tara:strand:+ start:3639 stop:5360 length:1722 start_codon:yes stop_codon:yes gene_type:complete
VQPLPEKLQDFRYFLILTWRHLNLPDPTPVQLEIAEYLQHGPRRKIIQAFRGVGKSWITSAYVVWKLRMDPQLKFLVVSASKDRADNFSTFTMRLITEMDILAPLRPDASQRNSKISFDVRPARADHAPSVKSVGVLGQMAGSRADEVVADDVEVPNNSFTQPMRDKLSEAVKEFDAILKPKGKICFLGTPQTEQSLYLTLEERGYETCIWPARYPNLKNNYGDRLAPKLHQRLIDELVKPKDPVDPDRFNAIDLMEREASYGRSGFSLQFMLDTSLSDQDRYPLKLSDLIISSVNPEHAPEKIIWSNSPEYTLPDLPCVGFNGDRYYRPAQEFGDWIEYTGSVMSIDPSGKGKDATGYAIVKMLNGNLFVTDAGGLVGGYDDRVLERLSKLARDHKVNTIIVEENFGGGMFAELLKPYLMRYHPCQVENVRNNKTKEFRIIDTLEPVMNSHRLIIDRKIVEKDYRSNTNEAPERKLKLQLFYQMSRITRHKGSLVHDDILDALSGAVSYWTDYMSADEDRNIQHRKDELLHLHLDNWDSSMNKTITQTALGMSLEQIRQTNDSDTSFINSAY